MSATTNPMLRRRRRALITTAVTIIVLLTLLLAKISLTLAAQAAGSRAWDRDDPVAAGRLFALNDPLNLVERWIAPYNDGVAAYGQRNWKSAAGYFAQARESAPDDMQCRVALNQAWSLEAAGDEFRAQQDPEQASVRFTEAQQVLAEVSGCDAGATGGAGSSEGSAGDQSSADESQGEGGEDQQQPDQGEPPERSADPVKATLDRLDQKLIGGQAQQAPDDASPDSQQEELRKRQQEAARQHQSGDDDQGPTEQKPDEPGRTW